MLYRFITEYLNSFIQSLKKSLKQHQETKNTLRIWVAAMVLLKMNDGLRMNKVAAEEMFVFSSLPYCINAIPSN